MNVFSVFFFFFVSIWKRERTIFKSILKFLFRKQLKQNKEKKKSEENKEILDVTVCLKPKKGSE